MSAPSWCEHFGLASAPFTKAVDDDDLWVPSSRAAIVERLVEACHERAHVLFTGEPGIGKTCVLRALRHRLPDAGFRLTYCYNATLGRRDCYRQLCLALGLSPSATAAAVFYAINQHVRDLGEERVHPVFLLDEAHLLNQQVLEHLHILSNYEWDAAPLLSLVLVGLPELRDRMRLRKNRSLYSRIYTHLHALAPRHRRPRGHLRVRRPPPRARRMRARPLRRRHPRAFSRSVGWAPPRHRSHRHRLPQASRPPQAQARRAKAPPSRRRLRRHRLTTRGGHRTRAPPRAARRWPPRACVRWTSRP